MTYTEVMNKLHYRPLRIIACVAMISVAIPIAFVLEIACCLIPGAFKEAWHIIKDEWNRKV